MPLGLFGMELLTSTYCPNNPLGDMYVKTEAQMENSKLFVEMYNRYSNIAVTRYDWKNLPIGVNERLLNMSLYLVGKACFFEHEDYGLIALPCSNGSEYNLFYEPTRINAFSFGFTRTLSFGEFELVRNNPTGTPTALTVYTYIKRMMDVLRSIDVVCARMKRPYLILCEEKQKLTFINLLKRIKDNEDIVLAFKNYGIDKSNFEVAPLPSIGNIDQLWKTYRTYEDILYSAIGLDSKGDDKKERLLVDEVNANNMVTEMANEVNLKQLRLDIEKVNRRYGTNIEVDIKELSTYDYDSGFGGGASE